MRIGVFVELGSGATTLDDLCAQARAAELAGLDVCVIGDRSADGQLVSAATLASALSTVTSGIRVAVVTQLGDHPVEIAEELIVADLCLGGRLSAILDADGHEDVLDESLALLLSSLAPRPFRHEGQRWSVPATARGTVVVTPSPAQLELPIHVLGCDHADVAASHGVATVARDTDDAARAAATWSQLDEVAGARRRWRRIAVRRLPAGHDVEARDVAIVNALRGEQSAWGLDTCLFTLPAGASTTDRVADIVALGTAVRPRVQLEALPEGVEAMWAEQRRDSRPRQADVPFEAATTPDSPTPTRLETQ